MAVGWRTNCTRCRAVLEHDDVLLLCFAVLYCAVLYRTVLYHTVPRCTVRTACRTVPYCAAPYYLYPLVFFFSVCH